MLPIILETTDEKARLKFVDEFIAEQKIKPFNCFSYEPETKELSIKQIREIIGEATFQSVESRLFHILGFDTASIEAQNAFLKTLEEHRENLYYILSVNQSSHLLATIRSRSRIVKLVYRGATHLSAELLSLIEELQSGKLSALFQISNKVVKNGTLEFLESLLEHYRSKLSVDGASSKVLRVILKQQNLLKHNHIDPQTALDIALMAIYKIYRPQT